MATIASVHYHWELGIDWDAVIGPANASYLPGAFVQPGTPSPIKRPRVNATDTITFLIFDVTQSAVITNIPTFTINPRIGALEQGSNDPLMSYQPTLNPQVLQPSAVFSAYFGTPSQQLIPCFQYSPVPVREIDPDPSHIAKFLLNFFLQVHGPEKEGIPGSGLRTFVHDPEMIVGPHM